MYAGHTIEFNANSTLLANNLETAEVLRREVYTWITTYSFDNKERGGGGSRRGEDE